MKNELSSNLGSEGFGQEKKIEKVVSGRYEDLVKILEMKLKLDISMILPEDERKFDHTNLTDWLEVIDLLGGDAPSMEVSIPSKKGNERVNYIIQNLEEIKGMDEEVQPERLLYSTALAEAKLSYLENREIQIDDGRAVTLLEIMDEVYPAICPQIAEMREGIRAVREQLLYGDGKKVSLNSILEKMESKKKFRKFVNGAVIAGLILFASKSTATPSEKIVTNENTKPSATETVEPVINTASLEIKYNGCESASIVVNASEGAQYYTHPFTWRNPDLIETIPAGDMDVSFSSGAPSNITLEYPDIVEPRECAEGMPHYKDANAVVTCEGYSWDVIMEKGTYVSDTPLSGKWQENWRGSPIPYVTFTWDDGYTVELPLWSVSRPENCD